ncbi:DUF2505 domain-containing protein [Corynebacterium sputi]|uniref:DUF2505 domain-containing protein n=1 Tax=Corynebacterium sputi TaxID=489915 RepID=UPI0003FDFED5|nr:DUF2505 domain-containing protein [Corynebacterium sputi]
MATNTEIVSNLSFEPAKAHAALTSNEFWTLVVTEGAGKGEVLSFEAEGDNTVIKVQQSLDTDALPDAVKSFVKDGLTVVRTITWGPLTGDSATGTIAAEVNGFPVAFNGTQTLAAEGDASTLTTSADITVNVPMMGAMLEPKVADAVKGIFDREADALNEYLAKQ